MANVITQEIIRHGKPLQGVPASGGHYPYTFFGKPEEIGYLVASYPGILRKNGCHYWHLNRRAIVELRSDEGRFVITAVGKRLSRNYELLVYSLKDGTLQSRKFKDVKEIYDECDDQTWQQAQKAVQRWHSRVMDIRARRQPQQSKSSSKSGSSGRTNSDGRGHGQSSAARSYEQFKKNKKRARPSTDRLEQGQDSFESSLEGSKDSRAFPHTIKRGRPTPSKTVGSPTSSSAASAGNGYSELNRRELMLLQITEGLASDATVKVQVSTFNSLIHNLISMHSEVEKLRAQIARYPAPPTQPTQQDEQHRDVERTDTKSATRSDAKPDLTKTDIAGSLTSLYNAV